MSKAAGAPRVVVGVDGSPESIEAARFAADEASIRCLELLVVHGSRLGSARDGAARAACRADARTLVDAALAQVLVAPTTRVRTVVEATPPEELLTPLTDDAVLLVLGQHHLDLAAGRLAGHLAQVVGAYARCPVVVVPAGWTRTVAGSVRLGPRPIVVGLDEPSSATSVLEVAYEEAELRQSSLLILHASTGADLARRRCAATAPTVAEVVAAQSQHHPDVAIDYRFVPGSTVLALLDASSRASLLVLGRPRRPRGRRSWPYSVARSLLNQARCPLVVVPAEARSATAADRRRVAA